MKGTTMNEQSDLVRLNYFTGFFTTDKDWQAEQAYHRAKQALHNQWLHHKPGIIRSVGDELRVEPAGGLKVRVQPGAALDDLGRTIRLLEPCTLDLENHLDRKGGATQIVYLTIEFVEKKTDYRENQEHPQYNGYARIVEGNRVKDTVDQPDNQVQLELARIRLQPDAAEILEPQDPDRPQDNEIDRRYVVWTGPEGGVEALDYDTLQHLIQVMQETRRAFAALAGFLPVPSASDVRHGALTLEMLARTGCVTAGRLSHTITPLVAAERDVEQELGAKYGPILNPTTEFRHYKVALRALETTLGQGQEPGILNAQDALAQAARELSEMVVESPIADAGRDQTVTTYEKQATVTLDADASQARSGREIVRYHWNLE
jgi:hypothetical protein